MNTLPALSVQTLEDAHYRQMVNTVKDYAIFFLDLNGLIVSWNAGAHLLNGYESAEVLGKHISIFYPPELLDKGLPDREVLLAREAGRLEDEGWRIRKNGTRFWANIVLTRVDAEDGKPIGFSKITRDLTERRRQEDLLRHSEERFRLLVEGVQDYAIFMLDPSGHVISWNRGAQKNKGYEASEIIGKHFSVFYPPEVQARGWPEEELRRALQDGRFEDEGWRVRKDSTRFWASVVITTLRDEFGVHRGFAKVTRDLTERRRVTALEDEGRRITNFLAMLGHELRNPLAPISNAVELLNRIPEPVKDVVRTREIIGRQLKQLTRLVDDLLDVGRITSGRIHLRSEPVRLRDVLRDGVESVRPLAEQMGHEILVLDADADPWVLGDSARLLQVVSNLLHNAAKFTQRGGHISLLLSRQGTWAEIVVKDDGPGVAPKDLASIFDLFVQGDQDSARSLGGLGLGLSLVQQLVTVHGGTVSAFSAGRPGEGAEFLVQLPLIEPPGTLLPKAGDAADAPKTLLVVDDNRDSADTLSMVLEAMGYQTEALYGGVEALEALKTRRYAAVLLDLGMPGFSGLELAQEIKRTLHQPPPLIAITGYGQDTERLSSKQAGFIEHMAKPVDMALLNDVLRRVFAEQAQPMQGIRS